MARRLTRRRWRRPERLTLEHPPVARRKDFGAPEPLPLEPELARRASRHHLTALRIAFAMLVVVEVLVIGYFGSWIAALVVLAAIVLFLAAARQAGDRWMQKAIGVRRVVAPRLERLIQTLSRSAAVPVPQLVVVPGERANAFAFRAHRPWLVITSAALDMDDLVLEGIVAHEIVHLRDGDVALVSEFAILAGAPEIALRSKRILAWLGLPLWPISLVLRLGHSLWFPPDREHCADVAAALLTHYPPGLAQALTAAERARVPGPKLLAPYWFGPSDSRRAELVGEM